MQELRYIVGRTLDAKLLHATPQGVWVHVEESSCPFRPLDHPSGLGEHRQNMAFFDRFERQPSTRSFPRYGAQHWTSDPSVTARGVGNALDTCRRRGSGVGGVGWLERAVESEDRALRQEHGALDQVLQLANIARPGIRGQEVHEILGYRVNLLAQLLGETGQEE